MATRVGFRDLVGQATNNQLPDILTSQDPVDPTDVVNLQYFEANYARYYIQSQTAFTAVQGETEFTPDGFEFIENRGDVYYNGVQLLQGINYTVASGSITLTTPVAAADDWVVLRTYQSAELESFAPMRVVDTLPDPEDVPDGTVVLVDAPQTLALEQENGNAVFRMIDETGAEVGQVWTGDFEGGAEGAKKMYFRVRFADGSEGESFTLNSSGQLEFDRPVGSTNVPAIFAGNLQPSPFAVGDRSGAIDAWALNDGADSQFYALASIRTEQQELYADRWRTGVLVYGTNQTSAPSRYAINWANQANDNVAFTFYSNGDLEVPGEIIPFEGGKGLREEIAELKTELAALKEAMNV